MSSTSAQSPLSPLPQRQQQQDIRQIQFAAFDKDHLEERYGLLVILLLGESLGVSSDVLPKSFTAESFAVAIGSFLTAALCWFLYFGCNPVGFKRLPNRRTMVHHQNSEGDNDAIVFSMFYGDSLSTALFCYAHIGLVASLPLIASGFARLVEYASKKENENNEDDDGENDKEDKETNEKETKLLVCFAAAGFLIFSGIILCFGEDPKVKPGFRPLRKLTPSLRGQVRATVGIMLALLSFLSTIIVKEGELLWSIESWGGIILLALSLSAYLETRPSDIPVPPVALVSSDGAGSDVAMCSNHLRGELLEEKMGQINPTGGQGEFGSSVDMSSMGDIEMSSDGRASRSGSSFGDFNPMRASQSSQQEGNGSSSGVTPSSYLSASAMAELEASDDPLEGTDV